MQDTTEITYMNNTNIKSLNYTQFQQFVYDLLEQKEIEIVKDWNIGRVLYKDSSMTKLESLNFTQIRSRWSKKYNILVNKQELKDALEGIAEEITPKPDNVDEWSSEIYDYLEANKITKIKLKDLALKVFNLSNKELNMSTQHRLGSILRLLGYSKNTKTKEWVKVKTGDTEDTTTSEAIASNGLEGISNVSPIADREDTKDTRTIELENKLTETTEFAIRLNKEKQELLRRVKDLEAQLQEFKNKATPIKEVATSGKTPLDDDFFN